MIGINNKDQSFSYIYEILQDVFSVINSIWNYSLFSAEGQPVAISNIILAIIFLILGLKFAKYCSNLIYNKLIKIINLDINVTNLLGKVLHYILIIIVTGIVLDIAHLPLSIFTFIGGALVVSIGVGGQHVVNNFISGLVLMIENSIKVGDLIEIDNIIGRVISIDARSINVRTQENKNVLIPHSVILQNKVTNWTETDNKVRIFTKIEINHEDVVIEDLKEIILSAIAQNADVIPAPKPQMLLLEFNRNIMVFEINFWINLAFSSRVEVTSEINILISKLLTEHNITLAIDHRKPIN